MVAALPAASLNPATPGRGPRQCSGAMANCPNAGQGSPSATSTNGRPPALTGSPSSGAPHGPGHKLAAGNGQRTSRNLIHGDRLLPARYEILVHLDRPAVVELPAPVPMPRRPPFAPGVAAFADACDAWLKDDLAVVDAVLKALQGQPDPQTVAMLRAFAEGNMAG